jgi:predicted DNA-binding transcriptional regulator YafY
MNAIWHLPQLLFRNEVKMIPLDVISREARAHKTVVVDAYEKDGSRESREIEPYSLRPGKSDDRLMFWCLERNGLRSLLVGNIVSATPTGQSFLPRYPIEL